MIGLFSDPNFGIAVSLSFFYAALMTGSDARSTRTRGA
jgi:hypothetical protein